jgi:predicted phage terminase large subunit-like protein
MELEKSKKYKIWLATCERRQTGINPKKETPEAQQKRIEKARNNYEFFISAYFPKLALSKSAKFHLDAASYIKNNPNSRCVFEWARGHAKSTHMGIFIPLWLKIQKERQFNTMILVSRTQDAADRLLSELQRELQFNQLYINDFGKQIKYGNWAEGEFITSDGCFFMATGRGQIRGVKYEGRRPDYIVMDDIDDDIEVLNPKRVAKSVEWCLTALFGTMDTGKGRFICVGNRIAKNSILSKLAERPGVYHTVVNILDKNGQPSWKEKNSLKTIQEMRELMGERNFQKEYMNNPITEGAVFQTKNIQYGQMLNLREYRRLICYTDPSFKDSATADYKATMLVGKTPTGQFHVLKAFADQTSVSNMVAWHYDIMNYINGNVPVIFYMEANFMQDLMLDEFKTIGNLLGQHIPIIADKRKKPDKFARIEAMQPLFERNLIIFNEKEKNSPGMKVLEEQLLMFERGSRSHDDAPDALESGIWMLQRSSRTMNFKPVIGYRTDNSNW